MSREGLILLFGNGPMTRSILDRIASRCSAQSFPVWRAGKAPRSRAAKKGTLHNVAVNWRRLSLTIAYTLSSSRFVIMKRRLSGAVVVQHSPQTPATQYALKSIGVEHLDQVKAPALSNDCRPARFCLRCGWGCLWTPDLIRRYCVLHVVYDTLHPPHLRTTLAKRTSQ